MLGSHSGGTSATIIIAEGSNKALRNLRFQKKIVSRALLISLRNGVYKKSKRGNRRNDVKTRETRDGISCLADRRITISERDILEDGRQYAGII